MRDMMQTLAVFMVFVTAVFTNDYMAVAHRADIYETDGATDLLA